MSNWHVRCKLWCSLTTSTRRLTRKLEYLCEDLH
ncbi:hypothetical protein LINPERHAP1_LOCUS32003 [Linum perenne]